MDQRLTQSRSPVGRPRARRECESAAAGRIVQGRSIEAAERVDLIEIALLVHGHRKEREQRPQHEDTGGDVAIVLMDSRAHGGKRAEGDNRSESPAMVTSASRRRATRPTRSALSPLRVIRPGQTWL